MTGIKASELYTLGEYRARRQARRTLRRLRALAAFVLLAAAVLTWQFAQGVGQDRELERIAGRLGAVEQRTAYMQQRLGVELEHGAGGELLL